MAPVAFEMCSVRVQPAWLLSTAKVSFLAQDVGADEAVDYTSQQVDQLFKGKPFDAVIDPVGGEAAILVLLVPVQPQSKP